MSSELPAVEVKPPNSRWSRRIVFVLVLAVGVPVLAMVLFHFPPSEYNFYPRCVFHALTGWHCAGCGGTRAAAALVRGDIVQALAFNPMLVVLFPMFAYLVLRFGCEIWVGRTMRGIGVPGWLTWLFVVTLIAFTIARNVPAYPFELLAPHVLAE
jgi:hypothetical protein